MLRDLAMEGARNLKLQTAMAAGLAKDLAHKAGADKLRSYKDEVIYHVRMPLIATVIRTCALTSVHTGTPAECRGVAGRCLLGGVECRGGGMCGDAMAAATRVWACRSETRCFR
jgi:hypothetical protein